MVSKSARSTDAEAMGQNGLRYPLTEEHYCRLMQMFGRVNATEQAQSVLRKMDGTIGASTRAYNTLLQSCHCAHVLVPICR